MVNGQLFTFAAKLGNAKSYKMTKEIIKATLWSLREGIAFAKKIPDKNM